MANKFKRLADLRIDNDLLQRDVAGILGVNINTYPHWENGLYEIPLDIIDRLSLFYNVSIDYIVGLSDIKGASTKNFDLILLGKRLKEIRTENNISQVEIGSIVKGFTQMNCSRYERAFTPIPFSKLYAFAKKFGVSIDYLMGKSDDKYIKIREVSLT